MGAARAIATVVAVVGAIAAAGAVLLTVPRVSVSSSSVGQSSAVVQQADPFKRADEALRHDDDDEAIRVLLPLAEAGNATAQFRVGEIHFLLKKQNAEALKWFRRAAEQAEPQAMYYLGNVYQGGFGVPKSTIEALKWYTLAASRAEGNALRTAAENRDGLAKRMQPAQVAEAQRLARTWAKQHKTAQVDTARKAAPAKPNPQDGCSTAGRMKSCTTIEPWGKRTTITDLQATQKVAGKLQNIASVEMTFNDVKQDPAAAMAMIGGFMMIVLPSSTQDQRAALFEHIAHTANVNSVSAYGWTWAMNSGGPNPGHSVTFVARKSQ